jgi:TonB family protein
MKKWFKMMFVFIILLVGNLSMLIAAPDIVVQIRLYQGFTENGHSSGVIVSSYYLKKISAGSKLIPFTEVNKEREALMRVYHLKKVKQIARLDVILKGGNANKLGHSLVLNGKELWLTIANVPNKMDRFDIRIDDKEKQKVLMESEVIVPEKKTAVLGFKDSAEKIYFLAFNRIPGKGRSLADKLGAKSVQPPKLLYNVEPVYPADALRQAVSGEVVVKGKTDTQGRVLQLNILAGHSLLRMATLKALKKWKYSPWKVDGKEKPVHFSMIFIYTLNGQKIDPDAILKRCDPIIDAHKTKTDMPWIMEMVIVQGKPGGTKNERRTIGKMKTGNVKPPKLVRRTDPDYPKDAIDANVEDNVVLFGRTDTTGKVSHIKVLAGHQLLRPASLEALKQWQYTPWKVDGKAVPVEFVLTVIYRMKDISSSKLDSMVMKIMETNKPIVKSVKKSKQYEVPLIHEFVLVERNNIP